MNMCILLPNETLYHFTTFANAIEIVSSHRLRFGDFANTNDIAEINRNIYSMYTEELLHELSKYKFLSFTRDNTKGDRGFAIDSLWGYYAEKGNGVCLAFDKKSLNDCYKQTKGIKMRWKNIHYCSDIRNFHAFEIRNEKEIPQLVKNNSNNFFYTKHAAWKHEREYRLVIKSEESELYLDYKEALKAAIVCLPRVPHNTFSQHPRVIALNKLLNDKTILRYGCSLGNKELSNDEGKSIWSEMHSTEIDVEEIKKVTSQLYPVKSS